jgi:hypothetical protein
VRGKVELLVRIKRAVLEGNFEFSEKSRLEMEADDLAELDIIEAIVNASAIYKVLRSTSKHRIQSGEKLYVIVGTNLAGLPIYTKGKLVSCPGDDTYYFLVSAKRSLR